MPTVPQDNICTGTLAVTVVVAMKASTSSALMANALPAFDEPIKCFTRMVLGASCKIN